MPYFRVLQLVFLSMVFFLCSLSTDALSLDEIHNLLVSGTPAQKTEATVALHNMGFVQLLQSASHSDGIMRAAAIGELQKICDARAIPTLVRVAVSDPYVDSRHKAVSALGKMAEVIPVVGKDIFRTLYSLRANSTDTNLKWYASNALGMLGHRDVVADLHNVLRLTDQPDIAWQGLLSLSTVPTQGSALLAYELVLHPEAYVAEQALKTLYNIALLASDPISVLMPDGAVTAVSKAEYEGILDPGAGNFALRVLKQSSKVHPQMVLRHKASLFFNDAVATMKSKLLAWEKASKSGAARRAAAASRKALEMKSEL